jgi:transcriptional regulator with XRE-family HTH domain
MPVFDSANALKIVGVRLRQARISINKTIAEVAADAGIDPKDLENIENGVLDLHILTLNKLCKMYKVSFTKLLQGFDPLRLDNH